MLLTGKMASHTEASLVEEEEEELLDEEDDTRSGCSCVARGASTVTGTVSEGASDGAREEVEDAPTMTTTEAPFSVTRDDSLDSDEDEDSEDTSLLPGRRIVRDDMDVSRADKDGRTERLDGK